MGGKSSSGSAGRGSGGRVVSAVRVPAGQRLTPSGDVATSRQVSMVEKYAGGQFDAYDLMSEKTDPSSLVGRSVYNTFSMSTYRIRRIKPTGSIELLVTNNTGSPFRNPLKTITKKQLLSTYLLEK